MFCKYCGGQIADDALFCPNCGAKQTASNEAVQKEQYTESNYQQATDYNENTSAPQENKKNVMAILGFIFSFLIPLLGLIFSIIGLSKSKQTLSGKGFAVAGIIISVVTMVINLITLIAVIPLIPEIITSFEASIGSVVY